MRLLSTDRIATDPIVNAGTTFSTPKSLANVYYTLCRKRARKRERGERDWEMWLCQWPFPNISMLTTTIEEMISKKRHTQYDCLSVFIMLRVTNINNFFFGPSQGWSLHDWHRFVFTEKKKINNACVSYSSWWTTNRPIRYTLYLFYKFLFGYTFMIEWMYYFRNKLVYSMPSQYAVTITFRHFDNVYHYHLAGNVFISW